MKLIYLGLSLASAYDYKREDVVDSLYIKDNHWDTVPKSESFGNWCELLKNARNKKVLENVQATAKNEDWRRAISPAIAALVSPDLDDECKNLEQSLTRSQEERVDAAVMKSTHCPQATGCNTLYDISGIWNYGCWCNFGAGELMTGSGIPLNEFDAACQKFQLCTRCAKFDTKAVTDCNANTRDFNSIGSSSFTARCSDANADDCETYLCTCQNQLISDLLTLMWANTPYDPLQLHTNPSFDPSVCGAPNPNNGGDMDCCGFYPRRFPFNTDNKKCCPDGKQVMVFESC